MCTKPKLINHLYIILCGFLILIFNYGYDVYHTFVAIGVSCLFINFLQSNVLIGSTIAFHMMYLLSGYYLTATDTYDIKWTMPHCVLVLRLIGLSFDVSDGQRSEEHLSVENKKSCLKKVPSVIEVVAYTIFPASVLVGPQFPMRRYQSFINKEFDKYDGNLSAGIQRGCVGLLYLLMNQIGSAIIPDQYLLSSDYMACNLVYKWIILGLWGKITLYKYISCWLLSEGVATCFGMFLCLNLDKMFVIKIKYAFLIIELFNQSFFPLPGLTFAGIKNGKADWSGCENIKLIIFENAEKFQNYIDSFNVNTNHWLAEYIYKRLKFLGNRYISHGVALLFLAIWHGFHTGYYMCFLMEFIVMNFEKNVSLH